MIPLFARKPLVAVKEIFVGTSSFDPSIVERVENIHTILKQPELLMMNTQSNYYRSIIWSPNEHILFEIPSTLNLNDDKFQLQLLSSPQLTIIEIKCHIKQHLKIKFHTNIDTFFDIEDINKDKEVITNHCANVKLNPMTDREKERKFTIDCRLDFFNDQIVNTVSLLPDIKVFFR
jgi:hypothetical protein